MAMFITIAFEDETEAVKAAEQYLDEGVIGELKGIYKMPTQFCSPMDPAHSLGRRVRGYTQGKKYGWWVCSICMKPSEVAWNNYFNYSNAFNLIDRLFPVEGQHEQDS